MNNSTIFGIPVTFEEKEEILEQIKKYLQNPNTFFHIVSLNPEILVSSTINKEFKKVLSEGDIQICDGIGTLLGCSILGVPVKERIHGVDLMEYLLRNLNETGLSVLLLGARGNLAEKLAECYQKKYPRSKFYGLSGFQNIKNPSEAEQSHIQDVIQRIKPSIIFTAFGSPEQELWMYRHKNLLKGSVCMGVGGGFDFLSGQISRAPVFMRRIGLEWLYRLYQEPWRWKRQLNLLRFVYLVFKQKITGSID